MTLILPIVPVVLPADLVGAQNGNLDLTKLTKIGNTYLHPSAARGYFALKAAFEQAFPGIVLGYTGMYRTYQNQVLIFDHETYPASGRYQHLFDGAACIGSSVYKVWHTVNGGDGRIWFQRKGTAMAAEPGTSNHGLGLAVDFAIGANPATAMGLTTAHVQWFIDHAINYGYSAEAQSEDWHWRWISGDVIPPAVLAHETSTSPVTPPAVPEEDDMVARLIQVNDGDPAVFSVNLPFAASVFSLPVLQELQADGLVSLTITPVSRVSLKAYTLVGALPDYSQSPPGPRTTLDHFAGHLG